MFSISPGAPFLRVLAQALAEGRLVNGFRPLDDPLILPKATIYFPTRRAARAFSDEIITAMGGRAALLPNIRTLGDDPDDMAGFLGEAGLGVPAIPAIPPAERLLKLARLVRGWTSSIAEATRELFGDEDIVIPSSASEALRMAGELARLLDQFETEEVDIASVLTLKPQEDGGAGDGRWADWWNLTLEFLAILSQHWPQYLAERDLTDPARARRMQLDLRVRHYRDHGSDGPVIVAGSTGSIPATARLIAAIARLPNGAVVLPGLDRQIIADLQEGSSGGPQAEAIEAMTQAATQAATHAQFSLSRLLGTVGVLPADVIELGEATATAATREAVIANALLPANQTTAWAQATAPDIASLEGISLIEAAGEREEALAISIALREALEDLNAIAALTTPDRKLARRVAAELHRFGIEVDDSAGIPLTQTQAGIFVRQLLAVAFEPPDPVALAAFVKQTCLHIADPLAGARHARLLELATVRDAILLPEAGALAAAVDDAMTRLAHDRHPPAPLAELTGTDWAKVRGFAARLDAALWPMVQLNGDAYAQLPLCEYFRCLNESLEALFGADNMALSQLSGGPQVLALIEGHAAMKDADFTAAPGEFAAVAEALLETGTVRATIRTHPRLHIWGPLEARLQHADLMVLGGLNEGTWPGQGRNDAFLNRPMRAEIGLSLPERRIGQAAHDFQQLSGHTKIIYSRSVRSGDAPSVASRWLQRLQATLGKEAFGRIRQNGDRYLQLAREIDRPVEPPSRITRPEPKPPVELRPQKLSVTEIETWIRDPYAIFARHVLELAPLPPLERSSDALLKGNLYHDIVERFVLATKGGPAEFAALEDAAREVFEEQNLPGEIVALWLPRFLAIGRLFVEWETERRGRIADTRVEKGGRLEVGESGFILSGRADRIDLLPDGSISVIDYKTGTSPSNKQARTLSPQLSLEAKMAMEGAFGETVKGDIGEMLYVRLRPGDSLKVDNICLERGKPILSPGELVAKTWASLKQLIAAFEDPDKGYVSRRAPFRESETGGNYDHLARVREWSIGEQDDANE